jgi:hypothetical protein
MIRIDSILFAAARDVRIKLAIGCHDRKLLYVPKLLKKLSPQEIVRMDGTAVQAGSDWRMFYVYQGNIDPNRFVSIEMKAEHLKVAA